MGFALGGGRRRASSTAGSWENTVGAVAQIADGGLLLPSKIAEDRRRALAAEFHALRTPEGRFPAIGVVVFAVHPSSVQTPSRCLMAGSSFSMSWSRPSATTGGHWRYSPTNSDMRMDAMACNCCCGAPPSARSGPCMSATSAAFWPAAPAAVVQAKYSQDLEQQADDYGAALLAHNGMSPALLADALEKLAGSHPGRTDGGYLSTHPSTELRMRHLRMLAASFSAAGPCASAAPAPIKGTITATRVTIDADTHEL